MQFNAAKLKERVAKLQEAIRIMEQLDPEVAALLVDSLVDVQANGVNGSVSNPSTQGGAPTRSETQSSPQRNRPRVLNSEVSRNGLKATVVQTIRAFGEAEYDVNTVYDRMVQDGFPFRSKRPSVSVGIEIRKLHGEGQIELVKQGGGSIPNTFKNLIQPVLETEDLT